MYQMFNKQIFIELCYWWKMSTIEFLEREQVRIPECSANTQTGVEKNGTENLVVPRHLFQYLLPIWLS